MPNNCEVKRSRSSLCESRSFPSSHCSSEEFSSMLSKSDDKHCDHGIPFSFGLIEYLGNHVEAMRRQILKWNHYCKTKAIGSAYKQSATPTISPNPSSNHIIETQRSINENATRSSINFSTITSNAMSQSDKTKETVAVPLTNMNDQSNRCENPTIPLDTCLMVGELLPLPFTGNLNTMLNSNIRQVESLSQNSTFDESNNDKGWKKSILKRCPTYKQRICEVDSQIHKEDKRQRVLITHSGNSRANADLDSICSLLSQIVVKDRDVRVIDKSLSIALHLKLLLHCVECQACCSSQNCQKMFGFLQHRESCTAYRNNMTCVTCKRVNLMLVSHSKKCVNSDCKVPYCQNIGQIGSLCCNSIGEQQY